MNKCCYCRQEVINVKEGFISKNICYHNICFHKKFKKTYQNESEHIVFYEG